MTNKSGFSRSGKFVRTMDEVNRDTLILLGCSSRLVRMQIMLSKIRYEINHCRSQVHKVRWQYDKVETGYAALFGVNVEN